MDNKVDNSGSEKVDKLRSTVDALTKQVNSFKSELWEIKNEKRGDKCYSGSKYLCRDCFNNNKQILHDHSLNIKIYLLEVNNIQRGASELNIISRRVDKSYIQQE